MSESERITRREALAKLGVVAGLVVVGGGALAHPDLAGPAAPEPYLDLGPVSDFDTRTDLQRWVARLKVQRTSLSGTGGVGDDMISLHGIGVAEDLYLFGAEDRRCYGVRGAELCQEVASGGGRRSLIGRVPGGQGGRWSVRVDASRGVWRMIVIAPGVPGRVFDRPVGIRVGPGGLVDKWAFSSFS